MSDVTSTVIQQRPAYIQGYDEALLQRIFGGETPQLDAEGNPVLDADGNPVLEFSGGLIDDPELFNQLDYVQAEKDDLQSAVTGGLIQPLNVKTLWIEQLRILQTLKEPHVTYLKLESS